MIGRLVDRLLGRRCPICHQRRRDIIAHTRGAHLDPLLVGRNRAARRDFPRRTAAEVARVAAEVDECRRRHTGPPCPGPCRFPARTDQ